MILIPLVVRKQSESICSLKFAARVRTVELGKATKNERKAAPAKKA